MTQKNSRTVQVTTQRIQAKVIDTTVFLADINVSLQTLTRQLTPAGLIPKWQADYQGILLCRTDSIEAI